MIPFKVRLQKTELKLQDQKFKGSNLTILMLYLGVLAIGTGLFQCPGESFPAYLRVHIRRFSPFVVVCQDSWNNRSYYAASQHYNRSADSTSVKDRQDKQRIAVATFSSRERSGSYEEKSGPKTTYLEWDPSQRIVFIRFPPMHQWGSCNMSALTKR